MQLGDREKNSIVISLVLNITLVLIFSILGIYHSYGKYEIIEGKKNELVVINDSMSGLKSKGLTFGEFNSLKSSNSYTRNEYLDIVLKDMKSGFYSDNFINKKGGDFKDFLKDKERALFDNDELLALTEEELDLLDDDIEDKVRDEKNRKEKMIAILPSYNPDLKVVDDNLLTDFKFVNYIESITKTFNLGVATSIGIGNISPYSNGIIETKSKKKKKSIGESKIFYIPISFSTTGEKKDILNFLHYIGNVGNINITDGGFDVMNDEVLFYPDDRKMLLVGDYNKIFGNGQRYRKTYADLESVQEYNIYNNQIIDLESISMSKYPVSFFLGERSEELGFIDFLKSNIQKEDSFEVQVNLRFYIKGIPNYKMIEFIKTYIKDFKETKKTVSTELARLGNNKEDFKDGEIILLKNQYEKANAYLNSISQDIKKFETSIKKGSGIDSLYENILEYNKILKNIKSVLGLSDESFDDEILEENNNN